jgi:hypothetical protein
MSVTTPGRPASPENSAANESDEANGAPARELLRAQREGRLASPARGGQGSPNKSPARETALSWSDCLMELAAEGPNHQRQAATPTPSRRVGCTARAGGCQTKAPQRSAGERAGLSQHAGRRKRQRKRSPHRNTLPQNGNGCTAQGSATKSQTALCNFDEGAGSQAGRSEGRALRPAADAARRRLSHINRLALPGHAAFC